VEYGLLLLDYVERVANDVEREHRTRESQRIEIRESRQDALAFGAGVFSVFLGFIFLPILIQIERNTRTLLATAEARPTAISANQPDPPADDPSDNA